MSSFELSQAEPNAKYLPAGSLNEQPYIQPSYSASFHTILIYIYFCNMLKLCHENITNQSLYNICYKLQGDNKAARM